MTFPRQTTLTRAPARAYIIVVNIGTLNEGKNKKPTVSSVVFLLVPIFEGKNKKPTVSSVVFLLVPSWGIEPQIPP